VDAVDKLLLCFGGQDLLDRRTVGLVSDDDAPFSASVDALADGTVSARSALCHMTVPLSKSNNIPHND
jgi:hypothetical protein